MRLKSLAPRKGKIEVEVYDKRIMEIENHMMKYEQHTRAVLERNKSDEESNSKLIEQIDKDYVDLNTLFEKIIKGIGKDQLNSEEEQTPKGLEDKYKKFKTSFYENNLKIQEYDEKLKQYSKTSPESILNSNKNFINSFQLFETDNNSLDQSKIDKKSQSHHIEIEKKGTYSLLEVEYYKKMVEEIDNIIKQSINSRETNNKSKINSVT